MQMAVSFAGAAIGSMFGQPQIGWLIGTALGAYLFPAEQAKNSNRLEDLKVSSSSYGRGIPIPYGRIRCSANMIWATDLTERPESKKGKSAKKTGNEVYKYSGNFAMGLCEGPINRVLRIWADSREIWRDDSVTVSQEFESTDEWVMEQREKGWPLRQHLRFYLGTEDQEPDGLIVAHEGADRTPAHRGMAYIVFENFPLEEFGNRTPTINVEVERILDESASRPVQQLTARTFDHVVEDYDYNQDSGDYRAGPLFAAFHSWVDRTGRVIHLPETIENVASPRGEETIIRRFDIDTLTELAPFKESIWSRNWTVGFPITDLIEISEGTPALNWQVIGGVASGEILVALWDDATPADTKLAQGIALLDGTTGAINQMHEFEAPSDVGGCHLVIGLTTRQKRYWCAFGHTVPSTFIPGISDKSNSVTIGHYGKPGYRELEVLLDTNLGQADRIVWSVVAIPGSDPRFVAVAIDRSNLGIVSFYPLAIDDENETIVQGAWQNVPTGVSGLKITSAISVAGDCIVVFGNKQTSPSTFSSHVMIFSADDFSLLFHEQYADTLEPVFLNAADPVYGTDLYWAGFNNTLMHLNVVDRTLRAFPGLGADATAQSGLKQYYIEGRKLIASFHGDLIGTGTIRPGYGAISKTGTDGIEGNLDDILFDLSKRVGIDLSDVDVSGLEGETIDGYLIEAPRPVKDVVAELMKAYLFDAAEVDGKIAFRSRARESVRTIAEADFALLTEDNDQREEHRYVRPLVWDAPKRVSVSYINRDNDYQVGTEASQRNSDPFPTIPNTSNLEVNFPIALTPARAKLMSWRILKSIWSERETMEFRLPWTHVDLDATDVVTVELNDGSAHTERLLKADFGGDLTLEIAGVNHYQGAWTNEPPDLTTDIPPRVIGDRPKLVTPVPFLLDIPLLDDTHDPGEAKLIHYVYAGAEREGMVKAAVLKSWNDSTPQTVGRINDDTPYGFVIGLVPPPANGWWGTDRTSRIRLQPIATDATQWTSADSEDAFRAGQNVVLIRDELIYYRDVEIDDDGTVVLSHLLRGRRGTEWAIDRHGSGDSFMVPSLSAPPPVMVVDALTNQGSTLRVDIPYVTASGSGEVSHSIVSRANSRRSYAPVHLTCTPGVLGVQFLWVRRSRLDGPLRSFTDAVPDEANDTTRKFHFFVLNSPHDPAFDPDDASTFAFFAEANAMAYFLNDGPDLVASGLVEGEEFTIAICEVLPSVGRGFFAFQTFLFKGLPSS